MRNGHSKILILSLVFLSGLGAGEADAQGGDGRTDSVIVRTTGALRRSSRVQRARKIKVERPVAAAGRIAVIVNESGSEILLSASSESPQLIATTSRPSTLVLRSAAPGSYTVVVRKPGYFEEKRIIALEAGKRRTVRIDLRPRLSMLSVSTNVADAEIEIESVGRFKPPLTKFLVNPGVYPMSVKRRGYISQQISLNLKTPGSSHSVAIVLKPLRIDEVLDDAEAKIHLGQYVLAAELASDVLKLNPSHARANLLFGTAGFDRGLDTSIAFLLKAIASGEAFVLPVQVEPEGVGSRLAAAEIVLDREGLAVRSRTRGDLNYMFKRDRIDSIENVGQFLIITGDSELYGRPIKPALRIMSDKALLGRLITAWRASS